LTFEGAFYKSLVFSQGFNLTNWRAVLSEIFNANISRRKTASQLTGLVDCVVEEHVHPAVHCQTFYKYNLWS